MADAILKDLQEATRLKAEGGEQVTQGKWRLACAKYTSALACLEGYRLGSTGRICPSEDHEYQSVWTGLLEEHANLELACYLNVALCRLKCEEWNKAVEAASEVLRVKPRHPKALFRRGVAHLRRSTADGGNGMWLEEAKTDLSAAAVIEPQNRDIRVELQAAKDALKAHREVEAAAKAQGEAELPSALNFSTGGSLYEDVAAEPLERMCRAVEDAADLRTAGRPAEALARYKSAMKEALVGGAGEDAKLTIQLGTGDCCMDLQNFERAAAQYEAAAEIAHGLADARAEARAWCCAGAALELQNKVALSKEPYEKGLAAAHVCGDEEFERLAQEGLKKASAPEAQQESLDSIVSQLKVG